ncbi:hypothetical protein C7212DRAFT_341054 [Tuber magnatum]|uniref:Uncharacterized protein n=1 Tax=Tuber magnatum TaxID=42249 RepID=A0A317T3A8_9PEZI|nr:hypothetical protein C7212DRAFT_341054 [Tuber magnatum]
MQLVTTYFAMVEAELTNVALVLQFKLLFFYQSLTESPRNSSDLNKNLYWVACVLLNMRARAFWGQDQDDGLPSEDLPSGDIGEIWSDLDWKFFTDKAGGKW